MPRCSRCHRRLASGVACPDHAGAEQLGPAIRRGTRTSVALPRVTGYQIAERDSYLGGGGFADVWAARATGAGHPVAIKVGRAATELARARFAAEARALDLVGPRFAPRLYEHGALKDGRPYLIMELLRGDLLAERLGRFLAPPDIGWVHRIADAVLEALEAIHQVGLIHGDLKPAAVAGRAMAGGAPHRRIAGRAGRVPASVRCARRRVFAR